MKLTSNFILFLFIFGFLFSSCQDKNRSTQLLQLAEASIDTSPDQALLYLDSIDNPKDMEKDSYMRYIVAYVGAKKATKKSIASDTFIFEAEDYFEFQGDPKFSALASYYAGWVYHLNKNLHLSLESFMNAAYNGQKINNSLLTGNSFNNIGYIYFEKDLFDSAIVNYQKALPYYDKVENATREKLTTFTYLGSTYEALNQLDSASIYFKKCLSLTKETKNEEYQFYSLKNLGLVYYGKQEYEKSIGYYKSALDVNKPDQVDKLEITKIHLFLLHIYNKINDLKSARQYVDLLTTSLPDVSYIYTTKGIYGALSDFYQQTGDFEKSLHYRNLEKITQEQIIREADAASLLAVDKRFHMAQQAKEKREFEFKMFLFLTIAVTGFVVSVFFVFLFRRSNKKEYAIIQEQLDNIDEMRKSLANMREESIRYEAEIQSIISDIDEENDRLKE